MKVINSGFTVVCVFILIEYSYCMLQVTLVDVDLSDYCKLVCYT